MENSISVPRAPAVSFSNQPIKAFLGLKKYQWSKRVAFQTIARDCLESKGISNIISVSCFLKNGRSYIPSTDPNVVNLFLRLNGRSSVDIIA